MKEFSMNRHVFWLPAMCLTFLIAGLFLNCGCKNSEHRNLNDIACTYSRRSLSPEFLAFRSNVLESASTQDVDRFVDLVYPSFRNSISEDLKERVLFAFRQGSKIDLWCFGPFPGEHDEVLEKFRQYQHEDNGSVGVWGCHLVELIDQRPSLMLNFPIVEVRGQCWIVSPDSWEFGRRPMTEIRE